MNDASSEAHAVSQRALDLAWIRWKLARLAERRLVAPLALFEQDPYRELLRREHELMESQVVILDARGREESVTESTDHLVA